MATIINTFSYFADPNRNRALFNGYLYFGVEDTDPVQPSNQIQVRAIQEDGSIVDIPQPVRTNTGGVAVYNGSPIQIDIAEGTYSVEFQNKQQVAVYTASKVKGRVGLPPSKTFSYDTIAEATDPEAFNDNYSVIRINIERFGAEFGRISDGTDYPAGSVFQEASGQWWAILPSIEHDVRWYGAKCDFDGTDGTDDTQAIQDALDYCMYIIDSETAKKVTVPGRCKTTDTIHVGYGYNSFTQVIFQGVSQWGKQTVGEVHSGLYPTFNDRPCVNIQGARFVRIRDLAGVGVNYDHVRTNYDSFSDRSDVNLWKGPNLVAASDTKNSPYVGICIDAYSGSQPAEPYPAVSYPAFLGASVPQYNKNFSSNVVIDGCNFNGFVVGYCNQPNNISGSGDFITHRNCDYSRNIVAYADGHDDQRNTNIDNCRLHFCHTVFDSLSYGLGIGTMNILSNGSSFDNCYRLFNIDMSGDPTQGGYSVVINQTTTEALYELGNVYSGTGSTIPGGISFNECKFQFSLKGTEKTPKKYLTANGAPVTIRNFKLLGGAAFYNLDADLTVDNLSVDFIFQNAFESDKAGASSYSFVSNIWGTNAREIFIHPYRFITLNLDQFKKYIDSEKIDTNLDDSTNEFVKRGFTIPWFANHMSTGSDVFPVSSIPKMVVDRSTYNLTGFSKGGRDYTFTVSKDFLNDNVGTTSDAEFHVGKGDIIVDKETDLIFYISSITYGATDMTIVMKQLNAISFSFPNWSADGTLSLTTGELEIHNSRRVYPSPNRCSIETTSSTQNVQITKTETFSGTALTTLPVEVDDYFIRNPRTVNYKDLAFDNYTKVVTNNVTTGAITVNKNALRDYFGEAIFIVKNSSNL